MKELERKKLVRMIRLVEYLGIYQRMLSEYLEQGKYDEFMKSEKEISSIFQKYFRSISALDNENMRNIIKTEIENEIDKI